MTESKIFIKQLTPAEVGLRETHEYYIRMTNDFDYESFFNHSDYVNGSVIQVDFTAKDLSIDGKGDNIPLKFVYYQGSNHEKRIPSLKKLFESKGIKSGDVVCLESRNVDGDYSYFITFNDGKDVSVSDSSLYYTTKYGKKLEKVLISCSNLPLQQIFYGAPGTGKSHEIKELTFGKSVVRTTFHPDSDYSTFVGAYKPTSREMPVTTVIGTKSVPVDDTKGVAVTETKIVYEFVPQAFLQAYSKAWQLMAETEESGQAQPQFLIIEEINRGNCAQIFGDLFQLLDRNDNGLSEYPINADKDIENYLKKYFNECNLEVDSSINSEFDGYDGDIAADIRNGKVLVLPPNLCIWATMNTSDQSLFPIDSAFKRRWDWKYIPINTNVENWTIDVQDVHYSWSSFLNKINTEIGDTTSSEDKKLGFYFCKAKDGMISAEKFVSKVLFCIYNDVFKDYGFDKEFFKDNENGNKTIAFQDFFNPNGTINESSVKKILNNLGVEII